jgi:hypothetical protein
MCLEDALALLETAKQKYKTFIAIPLTLTGRRAQRYRNSTLYSTVLILSSTQTNM